MNLEASRAVEMLARFRAQKPEAARLAEAVCLATRIEPGLLREARLLLEPRLDASAEADLWFSPLVESWSARAFVLHPAVAHLLQWALLKEKARAHQAWSLVERLHPRVPPIVALEERVTWLALSQGERARPHIERELQRVLYTMAQDEKQGLGVARWAMRALPRFPEPVRELPLARMLAFGASARLGIRTLQEEAGGSSLPEGAQWVLPGADRQKSRTVRFELDAAGLTFLGPDEQGHRALEVLVPDTEPPLLELIWKQGDTEQHRVVIPEPGRSVPVPGSVASVWLRTLWGDEFELVLRPDERGLEPPRDLDPSVWESCVWIPGSTRHAMAYFIEPRTLASAALPFRTVEVGTSLEAHWKGRPLTVTLVGKHLQENVAFFEFVEEVAGVTPLRQSGKGGKLVFVPTDRAHPEHWIAYDLNAGAPAWLEGTCSANPLNETGFYLLPGNPPRKRVFPGAPILMGGRWMGHYLRTLGRRVLVCPASTVQEVLWRWRQGKEEAPEAASPDRSLLDGMWDIITERRSAIAARIIDGVEQQLGRHRKIKSPLFPSEDQAGFITRHDGWQVHLNRESLDLDGEDVALFHATVESNLVWVTLLVDKANRALLQSDLRFNITRPDWAKRTMQVECLVSLKLVAYVRLDNRYLDADLKELEALTVTSISDDIEVMDIQSLVRADEAPDTPLAHRQEGLLPGKRKTKKQAATKATAKAGSKKTPAKAGSKKTPAKKASTKKPQTKMPSPRTPKLK